MNDARLVSRAEIARLVGVSRPAITQWERRHSDYPTPRGGDGVERFAAREIAAWLDGRTIPANARTEGEAPGASYGGRFRAALGLPEAAREAAAEMTVARLITRGTRLDPSLSRVELVDLLLTLLLVRAVLPDTWAELVATARDRARVPISQVIDASRQALPSGTPHPRWQPKASGVADLILSVDEESARVGDLKPLAEGLLLQKALADPPRETAEYYTPRSLVTAFAELTDIGPGTESVRDPACGSGGFLVAAADSFGAVQLSGATSTSQSLRLAQLNTALHGLSADLRPGGEAPAGGTPEFADQVDVILANPPFNARVPEVGEPRAYWRFGDPPANNANFDWLQYIHASLTPGGRAAVIMPASAASSRNGKERAIRAAMVAAGAVECLIALPPRLFPTTDVVVTAWLLRAGEEEHRGEVLFVDATRLGRMVSRTERALSEVDVSAIVDAHRSWRAGRRPGGAVPSRVATLDEIRDHDHDLSPALYTSAPAWPSRPTFEELADHVDELSRLDAAAAAADRAVARLLKGYGR
ncbi:N-6 DNA methylase [Streptomyces mayteni]